MTIEEIRNAAETIGEDDLWHERCVRLDERESLLESACFWAGARAAFADYREKAVEALCEKDAEIREIAAIAKARGFGEYRW